MEAYDIAKVLKVTAQLMELHEENPFKVKSLANAAYKLSKMNIEITEDNLSSLESMDGIGKSAVGRIKEILQTQTLKELEELAGKTPEGVIDMLSIKGIGPKKVAQLWKELEIESIGELLYACNENRLISLKGFGAKTQEQVKKFIEFHQSNQGKYLYAAIEDLAEGLVEFIKKKTGSDLVTITGAMRRRCEIIEKIEILAATDKQINIEDFGELHGVPVETIYCDKNNFYQKLFETSGTEKYAELLAGKNIDCNCEEDIFTALKLQYICPELREGNTEIELALENKLPNLIEYNDLKGPLHNHSTYSDGIHTLREMAEYCIKQGWEYLGICDHSQSAFYAEGLKPDKILKQQEEIDKLNKELAPFKIFKGIESDILHDGSLDYPEEILKTFDFIVASVHSNLKMNEQKATERLLKAIENPYTTILGHMTGRLLLSRQGYPVDYKKIIDACAENKVIIELNANPHRLDIDWRWIPYCLKKGVMISINPDAHSRETFSHMKYGVYAARKGCLPKDMCFNTLSADEIEKYFDAKVKSKNSKLIVQHS